jgi:diaminohydroxyphosphoribosylaminopyrimidine deaminase/5-amino-6-(5-phosphoribosylamino)uracil reductase
MAFDEQDIRCMKEALRQARRGLGRTSPNPAVGAVIAREGRIVSKGYHHKAGSAHAEVEALNKLGKKARGHTLYVTLEPCNHWGRTPPCTEAILRAGIGRVVVGMMDPNPKVTGGGCRFLAERGVQVATGVLGEACRRLNESFVKFATTGRPFVTVKSALTLDGWTATSTGHSKWVTSERSRRAVHLLRDRVDAVMVGVGTVLADDPSLTTRLGRGRGKDPMRIVLDTHLNTPTNAKVLQGGSSAQTVLVVGPDVVSERLAPFEKAGASIIRCPARSGMIDLKVFMDILGKLEVTSLLVEGGASVIGSLLREGLVDKFYVFKAPKFLGGDDGVPMARGPGARRMEDCLTLRDVQVKRYGGDTLIMGYPAKQDL